MTQQIGNGHPRSHKFDDRSPEEIQRELDATRREMANTIHAIEQDLSTRQLVMRAMDYFKGGPLRFTENLSDAVVRNPIPVALIGAGLLMLSRADARERRGFYEYEEPSRMRVKAQEAAHGIKEKAHELKERAGVVREKAHVMREKAHVMREKAHDLRVRSGERVRRSVDTVQRTWDENPMLIGLVAIAAGAALAAALPTTRREREIIGPRRDRLVDEAKRKAEEAVDTVKHTAQSAVETAKDELGSVKIEDEPDTVKTREPIPVKIEEPVPVKPVDPRFPKL